MAARYFINGGVNSNWSTNGNWSATDGGVASGVKPTNADDVHFTGNSPAITIDSAGVGLSIDFTGYTNAVTATFGLTISGSVTLGSGVWTWTGAGVLAVNSTATLTSNGKAFTGTLAVSGSFTFTLADAWTVNSLRVGAAAGSTVINGFTLTTLGDLDYNSTTGTTTGTTEIVMGGTGGFLNQSTGVIRNNITVNATGTITFPTGPWRYNTGTLKYTTGTVVASSCDLTIASSTTLDTHGSSMTFRDPQIGSASLTLTLSSDLYCRDFVWTGTSGVLTLTGSKINVSRNLAAASLTTGTFVGTTEIVMAGTGNITTDALTTGRITCSLTINAPGSTITLVSAAGLVNIDFGHFKHVAGTVVNLASASWPTGGALGTPALRRPIYAR